jgi:hypothetical protein
VQLDDLVDNHQDKANGLYRATDSHVPSYEELVAENERLKAALNDATRHASVQSPANVPSNAPRRYTIPLEIDAFESMLFEPQPTTEFPSIRSTWPDIILPSRKCSMSLVEFDRQWNSWVHAALDHTQFEVEHDAFWDALQSGAGIDHISPSWLAVYFSVICVGVFLGLDDVID